MNRTIEINDTTTNNEQKEKYMKRNECDEFLQGYLDAALFCTDTEPPSGQDYVETGRADKMFPSIPDWFIKEAKLACANFTVKAAHLLVRAGDPWRNGSDFFYTRNRAGVGFWDRGYPEEISKPLTELASRFNEHVLTPEDIGQTIQ